MNRASLFSCIMICALAAALLLGCSPAPAAVKPAAVEPAVETPAVVEPATLAPVQPSATAAPTLAATATKTPAPTKGPLSTATATAAPWPPPTLTPPAGQVFTPLIRGLAVQYVLAYDPAAWTEGDLVNKELSGLIHQTIGGCKILSEIVDPPFDAATVPDRLLRKHLGRLDWELVLHGEHAYGMAALGPDQFSPWLLNYSNPECAAAQEAVLATLLDRGEYLQEGLPGDMEFYYGLWRTKTPVPTLAAPEGFSCPNTPPMRMVVDRLGYIIATEGVWLRSSPDSEKKNGLELFYADSPVVVSVTDGPVCGGKYVYWQVTIRRLGPDFPNDMISGWIAEGNMDEYFLSPDW